MKITIDTHNCSREELAELKEYLSDNCWDFKEIEPEEEPEILYTLLENSIHIFGSNSVKLNEKIRDEEMHEYCIVHRESLVDDLYRWIGEGSEQQQMMKDDLDMIKGWRDDYILSSVSTNAYISSTCSEFNETCKELIELNESL
jgi:hypothetical protein